MARVSASVWTTGVSEPIRPLVCSFTHWVMAASASPVPMGTE